MTMQDPFADLLPSAQPSRGVVIPVDPTQTRQTEADLDRTETTTRKTAVDTEGAALSNEMTRRKLTREERAAAQKELNSAFNTSLVLDSIREARRIAQEDGGTGWESLLKGIPSSDALRLKTALDPIFANLAFDRLQQMRDES
ncbi:MAG: hypothetical protein HRT64_15260, partial [Erythrobacter sp.]|nr:hypothetical protein [Erythrobacter sp.]